MAIEEEEDISMMILKARRVFDNPSEKYKGAGGQDRTFESLQPERPGLHQAQQRIITEGLRHLRALYRQNQTVAEDQLAATARMPAYRLMAWENRKRVFRALAYLIERAELRERREA